MERIKRSLSIITLIAIWFIASNILDSPLFLPSPERVLNVLYNMVQNNSIWIHLGATFGRVTLAIVITAIIAIPLGIMIAYYKIAEEIFIPVIDFFKFIPITAFSPLLILMLGIDEKMKITFLFIATFLSYLPSVIQICKDVPINLIETARTMGFSYNRTIVYAVFPYILPSLLISLVNLYGIGWTFVIIAEVTNTQYGLGHLMYIGSARGNTDLVFAAIFVIFVVSFVFNKVMNAVINRSFSWRCFK